MTHSPIAKNIKNLREKLPWTQEQLAGAAGLEVRTIQRAEGGYPLAAESLLAIAAALNVGVDELRRDCDVEAAVAYLDRFTKVGLRPVESGAALLRPLSASKAFLVRPSSEVVAEEQVQELAEAESMLQDLIDLVGDVPPTSMLDMLKDLDPVISRLRTSGRFVSVGTYKAPFGPLELDTMLLFVSETQADVVLVETPPRADRPPDGRAPN